jgi:hypothetical protein
MQSRAPVLAAVTLIAACAPASEPGSVAGSVAPADTQEAASATPRAQGSALRLEEAERSLDVGRDPTGARDALDAVIADPSSTPEQRDEARLGRSRALEAAGDKEGAIAAVEALLAAHPDGLSFPLEQPAEARLRKLLTGSDADPSRRPEDTRQASPFSRALTKYFPGATSGPASLELNVLAFGGSEETSDRLGTFALGRALREVRREACPLCDDRLSLRLTSGRVGSWIGIPRSRASLGSSLAIFYFDLDDNRIPARYDAELPLPSAEIAAHLERGEGLVAVRERPGVPPAILIAAPRQALLPEVEEALSRMNAIPTEPTAVPLKTALTPAEIQVVVRASFGGFRQCYEALLKTDATAHGKTQLHFSIPADGAVEGISVDSDAGLHDATFEGCMATVTRGLSFPATHVQTPTTVTYPILFSP